VICGHDDCGAIKGITSGVIDRHSSLGDWLRRGADSVADLGDLSAIPLRALVEKFVERQYQNLLEHAVASRALSEGRIVVHAWVYDPATGRMRAMAPDGVFHEVICNAPSAAAE
jgi:carbonic anhydrase